MIILVLGVKFLFQSISGCCSKSVIMLFLESFDLFWWMKDCEKMKEQSSGQDYHLEEIKISKIQNNELNRSNKKSHLTTLLEE